MVACGGFWTQHLVIVSRYALGFLYLEVLGDYIGIDVMSLTPSQGITFR